MHWWARWQPRALVQRSRSLCDGAGALRAAGVHRVGWAGMFAVIRQFQALDAKCSTVDHDNQEALLAAGVNVGDVSLMLDTCIDANANVSVPSRHSTPLPSVAPATEVS